MMLTAAKLWSTVVGSTDGFLLPLYLSTVFLLPQNTPELTEDFKILC